MLEILDTGCKAPNSQNSIGGVMVIVLALSAVDRGFEPRSVQTKDYKIGICCFSTKRAALRRKSKDGLTRNQNNVSECVDMSISGLLFHVSYHYKNPTKRVGLVQNGPHHLIVCNDIAGEKQQTQVCFT